MTTDLDLLEALEKAATPVPWCLDYPWDDEELATVSVADMAFIEGACNALPELIAEVRALRGIAEAARDFMALEHSYYGPVEFEDILRARLAAYDKEGSK